MKSLTAILMKGLAAVLPLGLTLYSLWWIATSAESMMRRLLTTIITVDHYRPGMGILAGLLVLFAVGSIVNAYVVRQALARWDELLERIPLIKTVYGAFRDVARLLPSGQEKQDLKSVVTFRLGEARLLGFVTREDLPDLNKNTGAELVAVYFPLSYMLGGITMYVPKTAIEHIDMPVEAAMRLAITGGMATVGSGHGTDPTDTSSTAAKL